VTSNGKFLPVGPTVVVTQSIDGAAVTSDQIERHIRRVTLHQAIAQPIQHSASGPSMVQLWEYASVFAISSLNK